MAIKPLGFGLMGAALIALIIGLFISPHEAGAPHIVGFYVLLAASAIVLAMGAKSPAPKEKPALLTEEASAEPAPDAPKSLPKAVIVAGAATAAAATAGLVASRDEKPLSSDDRLLEDLERDLFSDLAPAKPAVDPTPILEPDATAAEAAIPDAEEKDISPLQDVAPEAVELPEPAAQPVNGLLPDADLAALQAGEDPLAPLEGLEIVGAYDSAGTRFTMYSDGSVTAFGPDLDQRFKSLDALRAYIDKGK